MKCQYIDMTAEEAKKEHNRLIAGEKSSLLTDCVTCYACEEYCPYNNHPFYLIVEQQEKHGIYPVPKTITESQIKALSPKSKIKETPLKGTVIDMCTFPMLAGSIRGKLFKDVSLFMGTDVFCNLMYLHFGNVSVIKERVPLSIDNIMKYYLKPNKIDEFICFHD